MTARAIVPIELPRSLANVKKLLLKISELPEILVTVTSYNDASAGEYRNKVSSKLI